MELIQVAALLYLAAAACYFVMVCYDRKPAPAPVVRLPRGSRVVALERVGGNACVV